MISEGSRWYCGDCGRSGRGDLANHDCHALTDREREAFPCWRNDKHDPHWWDTDKAGQPSQPHYCYGRGQ